MKCSSKKLFKIKNPWQLSSSMKIYVDYNNINKIDMCTFVVTVELQKMKKIFPQIVVIIKHLMTQKPAIAIGFLEQRLTSQKPQSFYSHNNRQYTYKYLLCAVTGSKRAATIIKSTPSCSLDIIWKWVCNRINLSPIYIKWLYYKWNNFRHRILFSLETEQFLKNWQSLSSHKSAVISQLRPAYRVMLLF